MDSQLSLPLYNPRDRGRLNALRNIVAAVSDELRRRAPIVQGIVDFTVSQFPEILRRNTPLNILSADPSNPVPVSPYPFEIFDLVQTPGRPEVFATVADLVQCLNVPDLADPLQGVELIGVDESQVDTPLPQSALAFLKSVAFRMYKLPSGSSDEAAGPILSEMRMQLREDEAFESENKLLGYIRNNFMAYVSALTSLAFGRRPFVVLHGPLVRAIGGFSHLTFDYETARELLTIDMADAGEFELPQGSASQAVSGDRYTDQNLSFAPQDVIDGERNLRRFNEFCLRSCGRTCDIAGVFTVRARPPSRSRVDRRMMQERDYPGFCLYFWVLRSLVDLCRLARITVTSAIEDVSAATEMTRFLLPSLLAVPRARQQIELSALRAVLQALRITFPTEEHRRRDLYQQAKRTIDRLRLSDSNIFSYVLAEGQYTSPVQAYRYRTQNVFLRALGDSWLGIRNELETVLDALFPEQIQSGAHPGYRVLMAYVRTTPLREPIRVEYFDLPHLSHQRVMGPVYLLSLPYQEYGMPVILYYADKLARTPTRLVRTIIEREYLELVLQNRFSDPVSIMRVLGRLTRSYFQREGLR
jgi:hypothetical protein